VADSGERFKGRFSTVEKRIAVVDDDPKLVELVKRYLEKNGFQNVASPTASALVEAKQLDFDLVILDIMMPGIDGYELLKEMRKKSDAFVIFLSARSEAIDRVVGLELGADDYLPKPFEPRELLARIAALFRRRELQSRTKTLEGRLEFEEFSFELDRQTVVIEGREERLTTYEYLLLKFLSTNANLVLSRRQIEEFLEANSYYSYGRSVDVGISRLRKKIEPNGEKRSCLRTVRGRGYELVLTKKKS
jgi:two-component system, OmpR family, phosphate regulon response regulator OmpR